METKTAMEIQNSIWQIFLDICNERGTSPVLVTQAKHFMSNLQCAQRRNVMKELHKRGATIAELQQICPLSLRSIERIIYDSCRLSPSVKNTNVVGRKQEQTCQ